MSGGSMKSLAEQMAVYTTYHRNPWNRLTHFVGVPVIIFSILVPLAWLRLPLGGIELTGAALFVAAVLVYYYLLDVPLAIAMTAFIVPIVYCAEWVARMPWQTGLAVFLAAFIGGWALQLVGHVFEGRRPALADNLFQIFVAPIFLVAEAAFALGLRRGTREEVKRLSHRHDA
jgi:uncharacterized membrane protein YGL010W